MSENFTTTEQLIDYLDNELGNEDRRRLEKDLALNEALRNELNNLRAAQQSVRLFGLRENVAALHKEAMAGVPRHVHTTPVRRILRYSISVAAAAIILVVGTLGYQYATVNTPQLYGDIYTAYNPQQVRGTENNAVKQAYAAQNLQQVIQLVNKAATPTVEEDYLAGNASLQINNAQAAIGYFSSAQQINKTANTAFYAEDIEFYLSMAYLKNNQPQLALPLLTAIYNNKQHAYHDKISGWQLIRLRWLAGKK